MQAAQSPRVCCAARIGFPRGNTVLGCDPEATPCAPRHRGSGRREDVDDGYLCIPRRGGVGGRFVFPPWLLAYCGLPLHRLKNMESRLSVSPLRCNLDPVPPAAGSVRRLPPE